MNAGGPWVGTLIRQGFGGESAARVRLVRGSHIVTRRLFEHDRAYIAIRNELEQEDINTTRIAHRLDENLL